MLFSVIIGAITTAFFVVKGIIYQFKSRLSFWRSDDGASRSAMDTDGRIVLYSEGAQYASSFRPLLVEIERRGIICTFLSSDPKDPLLAFTGAQIATQCIGNGFRAWGILNTLRADVCIMTTPGLDVLQIKRSRHVKHYAHLIHSPTDKAFNRPYSFDHYDSIFTCGPHQERTIRALETIRGQTKKELYEVGCVYYDTLQVQYDDACHVLDQTSKAQSSNALSAKTNESTSSATEQTQSSQLRVLVAPTWGKNGLLSRYGFSLLEPLLAAGLQVTVRPHPQSRVVEPEILRELQEQTEPYAHCRWDSSPSQIDAIVDSDILVSDISGIVFDYCFLTGKPVLTMDFKVEKRGFEANDLSYDPWELVVIGDIGRKIGAAEIKDIAAIVRAEAQDSDRTKVIADLKKTYVVNFGNSAAPVVDALRAIQQSVNAV